MEETDHETWTMGTNKMNKESLTASEWWSSALGVVPYVSKTSPQKDYYVTKSMQGGNVTVVHIEGLYMFVVFCNLWRLSSWDCVLVRMLGRQWVLNSKGCKKKWSWPNFKVLSWNLPRGTEVNHENLSLDSWSFGRVSNQAPSEYKSDANSLWHVARSCRSPAEGCWSSEFTAVMWNGRGKKCWQKCMVRESQKCIAKKSLWTRLYNVSLGNYIWLEQFKLNFKNMSVNAPYYNIKLLQLQH